MADKTFCSAMRLLSLLWLARQAAAGPCDILDAATPPTPCVAAHSTTRALYKAYDGALYKLQRASDHAETDVSVIAPGGSANATAHHSFCHGSECRIIRIYGVSSSVRIVCTRPDIPLT